MATWTREEWEQWRTNGRWGAEARKYEQQWRAETAAAAEHARLDAMGRRRDADGQAFTADEFRGWYQARAQTFWGNAPQVRQAPDGKWYTETELAAWKTRNVEQAPASPAAEKRQAAGAPAEAPAPARETGDVDQAPVSPAAEQRQSAEAPAGAPERAREQAPASPAAEQRQAAGAPPEALDPAQEQAPAPPAADQRQAAGAPAEAPEPARETGNFELVPMLAAEQLWG